MDISLIKPGVFLKILDEHNEIIVVQVKSINIGHFTGQYKKGSNYWSKDARLTYELKREGTELYIPKNEEDRKKIEQEYNSELILYKIANKERAKMIERLSKLKGELELIWEKQKLILKLVKL